MKEPLTEEQHRLVVDNIPLAVHVANQYAWMKRMSRTGLADFDLEARQAAMIGLITAARTYKPGGTGKFSTYAYRACACEVIKYSFTLDFIKRPARNTGDKIKKPISVGHISLRVLTGKGKKWGESLELLDFLVARQPVDNCLSVSHGEHLDAVDNAIDVESSLVHLDERKRFVVTEFFGLGGREKRTHKEIGEKLGISRQYSRVLLNAALETMRSKAIA